MTTTIEVTADTGADIGKVFVVGKAAPLDAAALALRLVSSLKVVSYRDLLDQLGTDADADKLDAVMGLLQGCDPVAVDGLIRDVVSRYVRFRPDPAKPSVTRPLVDADMTEMATLGTVLMSFVMLQTGL
jgi:hypothetical protein